MKKFGKIFIALLICIVSLGIFTSCQQTGIISAYIKSGTLTNIVLKDAEIDYDDLIVHFTYHDGTVKEVGIEDLVFEEIDTSTTGNKPFRITYGDYSFTTFIKVVSTEAEVNGLTSLESGLLIDFMKNKSKSSNSRTEFYDRSQPLYVGTDNAFHFRISASGIDNDGNEIYDLQKVMTIITVELENPSKKGEFSLLTESDLEHYVDINYEDTKFLFTEHAIGNVFRVTVEAENKVDGYDLNNLKFSSQLTVIEGFNVYDATDLSVYDNTTGNNTALGAYNGWHDIKFSAGLLNVTSNAIILQNEISVTKDDVPSKWFWNDTETEEVSSYQAKTEIPIIGSLKDKDCVGIFHRTVSNGDQFKFIGNYFSVDFSNFPKAVVEDINNIVSVENPSYMTTHTKAFRLMLEEGKEITKDTKATWENLHFIGNAELDQSPVNSGGILLMEVETVNFEGYNNIVHNFYITFFFRRGHSDNRYPTTNEDAMGNYKLDKCKGYNSYSTLMYMWGAKKVLITNSEFKNAGGPAIIAEHVKIDSVEREKGYDVQLDIVASTIESKVTGKEPWFTIYNAGPVAGMLSLLDNLYIGSSKTIIADRVGPNSDIPQLNMAVVLKMDGQSLTEGLFKGYARIFDSLEDYELYYGINVDADKSKNFGLEIGANNPPCQEAFSEHSIVLQANGSGNWAAGIRVDENGNIQITSSSDDDLTNGSYCNVYTFLGMGVVLQLYDKPQP